MTKTAVTVVPRWQRHNLADPLTPARDLQDLLDPVIAANQHDGTLSWGDWDGRHPALLWVDSIDATRPGHGWGTFMMSMLVSLADRFGVELALDAHAVSGEPIRRLLRFYERFGFVKMTAGPVENDGVDIWPMRRQPRSRVENLKEA